MPQILDAVNYGVKNICTLTKKTLAVPPVPIRSFRKQKNRPKSFINDFYTMIDINDIVDVYEVWKVVLDDENFTEVYMVISAKCNLQGYRKAKWSKIKYEGFYSTVDEAKQAIYNVLT